MKMADFKALPLADALTMLNEHLLSIKDLPGRLEDNFKRDPFEFSYSLLRKNLKELGIVVDGKNYIAYKIGEQPPEVSQNSVKSSQVSVKGKQGLTNINKVKQDVVKTPQDTAKLTFTDEEIVFLKQLYQEHKSNIVKLEQDVTNLNDIKQEAVKPMLVVPQMRGLKKQTGISVYAEVWERWSEFKRDYSMYSGSDLLTLALEEFMDKYK